jgi:hypothetical protein
MATQQEIAHQIMHANVQYHAHQHHVVYVEGCMWCEEQAEYDARSVFDGEEPEEA